MNSEIERFAQAVGSNSALRDELTALDTSDTAAVVAFANSKGYNFTAQDVPSAAAISGGELSESQLGSVVGGSVSLLVIDSKGGGYVYAGPGWALYRR